MSSKITLNIDKSEEDLYWQLMDSKLFKKTLDLYIMAVFVGKYVLNSSMEIDHSKSYIRINDNRNKDNMTLLLCFGIEDAGDISIIKDEKEIFERAEKYARTGIKQLHEWYFSKNDNFDVKLATVLLDKWKDLEI